MTLIRVTKGYRITIPKEVREKIGISIGDILEIEVVGDTITIRKVKHKKRKRIKLGKELTTDEIENLIENGFSNAID